MLNHRMREPWLVLILFFSLSTLIGFHLGFHLWETTHSNFHHQQEVVACTVLTPCICTWHYKRIHLALHHSNVSSYQLLLLLDTLYFVIWSQDNLSWPKQVGTIGMEGPQAGIITNTRKTQAALPNIIWWKQTPFYCLSNIT